MRPTGMTMPALADADVFFVAAFWHLPLFPRHPLTLVVYQTMCLLLKCNHIILELLHYIREHKQKLKPTTHRKRKRKTIALPLPQRIVPFLTANVQQANFAFVADNEKYGVLRLTGKGLLARKGD